jgi:hypothetical protein
MPSAIALPASLPIAPPAPAPPAAAAPAAGADGDLSFWDFIDIINPLQHIPIVSNIWRAVTGDEIRPQAQVAGDILFGGPIGLVTGALNAAVQGISGRDVAGHLLALLSPSEGAGGEGTDPATAAVIAAATPAEAVAMAEPPAETAAMVEPAPPALRMFALPARAASHAPVPLPPAAAPAPAGPASAAVATATPGADGEGGDIAGKMLRALDGYRALARDRRAEGLDTAS